MPTGYSNFEITTKSYVHAMYHQYYFDIGWALTTFNFDLVWEVILHWVWAERLQWRVMN